MIIYVTGNNANYVILWMEFMPNNLHSLRSLHINAALKQRILFCSWRSWQSNLAEQTLRTLLRSFPSAMRVAVKHITRSDGINQLWSNKDERTVCVCVLVSVIAQTNRIFPQQHYPVFSVPSGSTMFPTLSYKRNNFQFSRTNFLTLNECLNPPTAAVWNISNSNKNSARCCYKCPCVVMWSAPFGVTF
jgi:hypothetical protein